MARSDVPDLMPVLSEGNHRSPRKGACFMELASYLAGEKWSDHPRCTHRLLSQLSRDVNDNVSDPARQRLAPMIPDVIGLNGDDPRVDAWIALDAALTALPVASAERQGVMALGAMRCEHYLNGREGRPAEHLSERTRRAFDDVPHATRWARKFVAMGYGTDRTFPRRSAPAIVHSAVVGIAHACIDDPDTMLVDLLSTTIANSRVWLGDSSAREVAAGEWLAMCELTQRP
jgi:hypothetical protein